VSRREGEGGEGGGSFWRGGSEGSGRAADGLRMYMVAGGEALGNFLHRGFGLGILVVFFPLLILRLA